MTTTPCTHRHVVDPPPGKHLRVCVDCGSRLVECSLCDTVDVAGSDPTGWTKHGTKDATGHVTVNYHCPRHAR
jgi:hypothetical protein